MLPQTLKYQSKVESANARSYRSNIQPQNGTGPYNVNELITINIPTRNNLCLVPAESFLKFTMKLTNDATTGNLYNRFDACGAHGLIQRIRVFHGSYLLSDIDNYGVLAKILMDAQVPTDATYGKYSILAGTRSDLVTSVMPGAATATQLTVNQVKSGKRMNIVSGDNKPAQIAIAGNVIDTYCINLISLVGTLCADKYIPLFAMTSAPLRVEIQLVPTPLNAVNSQTALSTTTPMQLTNVEYVAQMIEISDSAVGIISSSMQGRPLEFVFPDYKNYQSNATLPSAVATSVSVPIPAKYSSLKALFVTQRDSSKITALTYYPYSCNVFSLRDYTFRIGPQVVPSKAPETIPEFFAEGIKAIGSMSNLTHQPSIDIDSYSQNLPVINDDTNTANGLVNSGAFLLVLI
jgi:hypothetical protein